MTTPTAPDLPEANRPPMNPDGTYRLRRTPNVNWHMLGGWAVLVMVAVIAGAVWVAHGIATYSPTLDDRFVQAVQTKVGFGDGMGVNEHKAQVLDAGHRICAGSPDAVQGLRLMQEGASAVTAFAVRDAAHEVLCP